MLEIVAVVKWIESSLFSCESALFIDIFIFCFGKVTWFTVAVQITSHLPTTLLIFLCHISTYGTLLIVVYQKTLSTCDAVCLKWYSKVSYFTVPPLSTAIGYWMLTKGAAQMCGWSSWRWSESLPFCIGSPWVPMFSFSFFLLKVVIQTNHWSIHLFLHQTCGILCYVL